MSYRIVSALLLWVSCAVTASENPGLPLSAVEIDRLGIGLASPEPATDVEIGSGLGELVVPPAQQAVVGAPAGGMIARLLVAEGETIGAGQALAELQSPALLSMQREFIEALSADSLARAQLERDRGLRADGIIADKRLQETAAAARRASLAVEQLRQQLMLAGQSRDEIARLADRQQLSSVLTVRAPFDGIAVARLADLGQRVDTLDPVYRVADLSTLWLEVRVPQERAARIRAGHAAAVTIEGTPIEGLVTHIGHIVDAKSQTVLVRAIVDNPGLRLRAGQVLPARIFFRPDPAAGPVLAVPAAAVIRDAGRAHVFVRTPDGFALRRVDVVAEDGQRVYVGAGLDPASTIAVAGVAGLKSIWSQTYDGGAAQ